MMVSVLSRSLVVFGLLLTPTPALARATAIAQAEPGSALNRNAEAVQAGRAALEAYQRSDWEAAHRGFADAESLAHSPVFVLYMARSKQRLGAWLEAQGLYERVLREPVTNATPHTWREAVEAARAEHAELTLRIPSVVVVVVNGSPTNTTVTLDGVTLARWGEEQALDVGAHRLLAQRADGAQVQQELTVLEGQKRVPVQLTLPDATPPPATGSGSRAGAPAGDVPTSVPPRRPILAESPARQAGRDPTLAHVMGGAGLASLTIGLVAGALAWAELQSLKADCRGTRCDPSDASRLDSVRRLGTIADIGFVVGAAGLGTSAILLWVVPAPERGPAKTVGGLQFSTRY